MPRVAVFFIALLVGLPIVAGDAAAARKFKNCAALNRVYPHGVGKPGARDKTRETPVTNFKVSRDLYAAFEGKDRDGDGIACEKE